MASPHARARLRRLATAGGLTAAAFSAPPAGAFIVDSGPINLQVPQTIDGIYLNFLTLQTGSTAAAVPGWDFNPFQAGAGYLAFFWPATNSGGMQSSTPGVFANLTLADTVGPGSTFTVGSFTTPASTANFQNEGLGVLGFRFFNESTGAVNYGYAYLQTGPSSGFPATIVRVLYENSGSAIGLPIPEPSATALCALFATGALGLRAWRRR